MSAPRVRSGLAAFMLLAVACSGGPDAADLPPVPKLAADLFPPAVRAEVARLQAALEADPLDAEAAGELGMFAHAYDQLDAAERLYARSAEIDGASFRWRYYRGVVLAQQGKPEEAEKAFSRAAALDDEYEPLLLKLADIRLELGRAAEAEAHYVELVERRPGNAEAHYGLGRALAMRDAAGAAVESLSEATRLMPGYGQAHYELSLAYRDLGDQLSAARHLRMYQDNPRGAPIADDPLMTAVRSKRQGVTEYLSRAAQLEEFGNLPAAIDLHLEALKLDPEAVQVHVNLISLYGRTGEIEKAEEHYREALKLNSSQADLHYNYGVLLFETDRLQEARTAFEKALEANPDYAAAHNNLGQTLERQGKIDSAVRAYEAALAARPGYRLALFHLGRMMLAKRRPADAAEYFEQAIEPQDEMTPQILVGLMAAEAGRGRREAARRRGEQARSMAADMGHTELVARIDQEIAKLR